MEELYKEFNFPFPPNDYQQERFGRAVSDNKYGLWWGVGLGKTFMSTAVGLQHSLSSSVETLIFIVPPSLVFQWVMWFEQITFNDGTPLDILAYQGPPKVRSKMAFDHDVVIMSHNIFRQDYPRILRDLGGNRNIFVAYDEAHMGLRKPSNKIWRYLKNFTTNKKLLLLSATPIGNPMDTYGIVRLLDPTIYKTKRQFEQAHVADIDFFGKVTAWKNLELMNKALYAHADKLEPREVLTLPDVIYDKVVYQLSPKHKKKYDELVRDEIMGTDDGEVLDGTDGTRMFHLLQRFVTCPEKLKVGNIEPQVQTLVETVYHEDDSKLVVFANYRNTHASILEFLNSKKIKTVGCWGDIGKTDQEANLKAFMFDCETIVLVGNPLSMGVGLNLQEASHRILFAELPLAPREFYQSVGRCDRQGQKNTVIVKALIANGTIQSALWHALMNKDDIVNRVVKNKILLRELFS